ncbi:MAG: hypothetical protein ACI36W_06630 [Coriobacteriales bacterium]
MPLDELNNTLISITGSIDSFMYTYILVTQRASPGCRQRSAGT